MCDGHGRLRDIRRTGRRSEVPGQLGTLLFCLSLLLPSAFTVGVSGAAADASAAPSEPAFAASSCSQHPNSNGRWQLSVPVWPEILAASNQSVAICLARLKCSSCVDEMRLIIPWQADAASAKLHLSTNKCHTVEPAGRLQAASSVVNLSLPCTSQHLSQSAEVRLSTSRLSQTVFLFRDQPKDQCQRVSAVSANYMYMGAYEQRQRRPTPQTVTLAVCRFPGEPPDTPVALEFRSTGWPTVTVGADWLRQNGDLIRSADSEQLRLNGEKLSQQLAQLMQLTHGNEPQDGLIIVKEEGHPNTTNSMECQLIADSGPTLTIRPLPKEKAATGGVTRQLVIASVFAVLFVWLVALSLYLGVDWRSEKFLVLAAAASSPLDADLAHRLERQPALVAASVDDSGHRQLLFRRADDDGGSFSAGFSAVFLVTTLAAVLAELPAAVAEEDAASTGGSGEASSEAGAEEMSLAVAKTAVNNGGSPAADLTTNHRRNGRPGPGATCTCTTRMLRSWQLEKLVYCLIMVDEARTTQQQQEKQELLRQHLGPTQYLGHQRWALVDSVEQCAQLIQSCISRKLEEEEHRHDQNDNEEHRELESHQLLELRV